MSFYQSYLFSFAFTTALLIIFCNSSCSDNLDCGSNIRYEICEQDECSFCNDNSQCNLNDGDTCKSNGYCEMISLVSNKYNIKFIANSIAILVGSFLAAGGGLGGGGIFVPCFILFMGFDIQSSAALSQAIIFGGSMVSLIVNLKNRHPIRNHRPLADFNTILILEPMLLGGTVVGVLLNEIMPDPIILGALMIVLIIAVHRMIFKGIEQWKKENAEMAVKLPTITETAKDTFSKNKRQSLLSQSQSIYHETHTIQSYEKDMSEDYTLRDENSSADRNITVYHPINDGNELIEIKTVDNGNDMNINWIANLSEKVGCNSIQTLLNIKEMKELLALVKLEERVFYPMMWMLAVWLIVSLFAILRSTQLILHLKMCSMEYWLCFIGIYPCLIIITFYISYKNIQQYGRKTELHWQPSEGDITWTLKKAIIYPMAAAVAGVLGGLLGIGGGMIISPVLMELGVLPRVASASSALAVLMTSSSSLFQKILLNMLEYDFMIFYMITGIVGTLFGQTVVNVVIHKYGRNSIVVFAISIVISIAIVLMFVDSVTSMNWDMIPQSFCDK